MRKRVHDWLATQIENARPDRPEADKLSIAHLVDAAACLLGTSSVNNMFGMVMPKDGVDDAKALGEACLAALREWGPLLDSRDEAEIGLLLAARGLPAIIERPTPPAIVLLLHVDVQAGVVNFEAEDEADDEVNDPAVFSTLDGVPPLDPLSLVEIPCIKAAVGGLESASTTENWKSMWALDGVACLFFIPETGSLRCRLTFSLTRRPSEGELELLLETICEELPYTGWGMNLEWDWDKGDLFETLSPSVSFELIEHRFEEALSG